jgi:hypothetical protein
MLYRSMLAALAWCAAALPASAQTAQILKHQPPEGAGIAFVLTNGTVLAQSNNLSDWFVLTPTSTGSYQAGTWTKVASLPKGYVPDAFASAVLADGRVVIAGGEYNNGNFALTDLCAVYDPVLNTWTEFAAPSGWGYIGDSPSSVLADGRFLLGRKLDKRIAALDPATLTWTELSSKGKQDFNAEEGWTLLPDGTVLTYDVKAAPNSERYNPAAQRWASNGSTVQYLRSPPAVRSIKYAGGVYHPPGEVGPAVLRPDGTVFATGAIPKGQSIAHTAIFTPSGASGSWKAGPDFPNGDDANDNFAALLPEGNVLVQGTSGTLYEFDGTHLNATKFTGSGGSLLVLPTGEVLVNGNFVYRESGSASPAWAPVIATAPAIVTHGTSYQISGTQFNGLSQAHGFGDEYQTATNYPLVRITYAATKHVMYARTHDHSSMGVATGSMVVSTTFDVPKDAETGAGTLVVVANGIASAPVGVTVQ